MAFRQSILPRLPVVARRSRRGGKTALRIAQLLSLATARSLTGQHVFVRCRVLLLSFEDGRDELQRRLTAALLHHNINRSELKGGSIMLRRKTSSSPNWKTAHRTAACWNKSCGPGSKNFNPTLFASIHS